MVKTAVDINIVTGCKNVIKVNKVMVEMGENNVRVGKYVMEISVCIVLIETYVNEDVMGVNASVDIVGVCKVVGGAGVTSLIIRRRSWLPQISPTKLRSVPASWYFSSKKSRLRIRFSLYFNNLEVLRIANANRRFFFLWFVRQPKFWSKVGWSLGLEHCVYSRHWQ